jgi:D-3-phosphoglycerate dehydrogenase
MKVLANDGISAKAKAVLEAEGITVSTDHVEQADLIDTLNREGYAGILVRSATKVRQDLIDACPDLRFIGRGGVGMDNIDVDYSSQSVAELVMAHLFAMARSLHRSYPAMPERGAAEFKVLKKAYAKGIELRGKTLGIVGFGRIGTSVAEYALGCGMHVIGVDREGTSRTVDVKIQLGGGNVQEVTVEIPLVSMDEMLAQADAVTFHVPAQADGSPVLDAAGVASMKEGAMLVNTARGGTVDEAAVSAAVTSGHLRAAALDVFVGEPTPDPALLQVDGLALTPHIGAATLEAQDRIGDELVERILELR